MRVKNENAPGFEPLVEDQIECCWSGRSQTSAGFVSWARRQEFRKALVAYIEAFPPERFPEAIDPWWVSEPDYIRTRIGLCQPYTKFDAPKFKDGILLSVGTDSVYEGVRVPCPLGQLGL